jgi:hypothetical protein
MFHQIFAQSLKQPRSDQWPLGDLNVSVRKNALKLTLVKITCRDPSTLKAQSIVPKRVRGCTKDCGVSNLPGPEEEILESVHGRQRDSLQRSNQCGIV